MTEQEFSNYFSFFFNLSCYSNLKDHSEINTFLFFKQLKSSLRTKYFFPLNGWYFARICGFVYFLRIRIQEAKMLRILCTLVGTKFIYYLLHFTHLAQWFGNFQIFDRTWWARISQARMPRCEQDWRATAQALDHLHGRPQGFRIVLGSAAF